MEWRADPIDDFSWGTLPSKRIRSFSFWGTVAVILIQSTYWIRLRCFPPLRFKRQLVLGHAIQFLWRLGFVFIGGMFSVVFFTRFKELEFSIWKVLFLLAVLFSLFCYTLELERLGKAFWEAHRPSSSFGLVHAAT